MPTKVLSVVQLIVYDSSGGGNSGGNAVGSVAGLGLVVGGFVVC